MRIGLRDILGLADFEQYLTELSALAEACLQYALEVVMRKHKLKIAALRDHRPGQAGRREIDYGSDLDVVFVADAEDEGAAEIAAAGAGVMDLVSARTEQGIVFHTDARLRPDGEKGLLVNTLSGLRGILPAARAALGNPVAHAHAAGGGRPGAGRPVSEAGRRAGRFSNIRRCRWQPITPDWKQKIHQMRMRIEKERTPAGKDDLAIKTGKGGLMDAEFIAQALCLENGWQEANTLRALERARDAGVLPDADKLIENYRQLRRLEGILRRWSYEGETVLPDDPAPYYRVSVRCGFATPRGIPQGAGRMAKGDSGGLHEGV